MREVVAAVVVLIALAIVALAPRVWPTEQAGGALASGRPTPAATASVAPAAESAFPLSGRPVEIALPGTCQVEGSSRHNDGLGMSFTVQCGSARANLGVAVAAMKQGWSHVDGPPIGVGLQTYVKGTYSMQIAYRLDGPGFSAPFQLVQYVRPFAQGAVIAPANPNAYVRVPAGFELPIGCAWGDAPAGFTTDGAYKIPFACAGIAAAEIQPAFTRAMQSQGWRIDNGGFGFLTYAKNDLRLNATFANEKAEPSDTPWVVESLCCFAP